MSSPQKLNLSSPLVLGAVALLTVGIYFMAVVQSLGGTLARVSAEVRSKRQTLQSFERALAQEATLREELASLQQMAATQQGVVPTEDDVAAVVSAVSDLANQTGVKIQTLSPQPAVDLTPPADPPKKASKAKKKKTAKSASASSSKPAAAGPDPSKPAAPLTTLYRGVPVRVEALAAYHALGAFISRVESDPRPMTVTALRITGSPKEPRHHVVKMTVMAYVARTRPIEPPSSAPAKKKKR